MEGLSFPWWAWMVLGLFLLVIEILTPGGFFFLFFGAGALLVGLLAVFGVAQSLGWQVLLFSLFSVGSLLLFRRHLIAALGPRPSLPPTDSLAGEAAIVRGDIPPGGVGQAELRGTTWQARNSTRRVLASGERCVVEKVEGLTLFLRPETGEAES